MSRNRSLGQLAALIAAISATRAYAIEKGNGAAVTNSALNYVGKWQDETTAAGGVVGTATVIRPGVVMGAAHLVQTQAAPNDDQFTGFTDRFELGGTQYVGLPVLEPRYAATTGYGNEDIALLILANGQAANSAPAGTLATAAQETAIINQINGVGVKAAPENVTLVGWQSADNTTSPNLLQGTSQIKFTPGSYNPGINAPAGLGAAGSDNGEWTYDTTLAANAATGYPGSNWIDKGDSGGPTFATINGATVIIGVHSFRAPGGMANAATIDVDTRVAPNLNFLNGLGDGGASVLDYLNVGMAGSWNTAANWNRTVPVPLNPAMVPNASDIAILDPTNNSDVGTTITLNNIATNNLNGLLNDVTLDVSNSGALNVTGLSGITNTGTINVHQAGSTAAVSSQVDNEGTFTVQDSGSTTVGTAVPGFIQQTNSSGNLTDIGTYSMMNGTNGVINVQSGGTLSVNTGFENFGFMSINNNGAAAATMNIGAALPEFVGLSANPGTLPTGLYNGKNVRAAGGNAIISVGAGGNLNVTNGAANLTALLLNDSTGIVDVLGSAAAPANATFDQIINLGFLNSVGNGTLTSNVQTINNANAGITVSNTNGVANLGWLQNNANATTLVQNGGTLNLSRPAWLKAGHSLDNTGTITVNGGGTVNVAGRVGADNEAVFNNSSITVTAGAQPATFQTNNGQFFNGGDGVLRLVTSVAPAEFRFSNSDLSTTGTINGAGTLRFTNDSSFIDQAVTTLNPTLDTRNVSFIFDGATNGGGGAVTMEAPTEDIGVSYEPLSTDRSAIYDLSIIHGSDVELTDNFDNSGTGDPEAIYTYMFGIDAGSTLDLNGLDVYYYYLDPNEGGLAGTIVKDGGNLIQIPEPGTAALAMLGTTLLLKRRRRA